MDLDSLSSELKERVLACESTEELLRLAQDEGYELTDDELDAVSGGWGDCDQYDPNDPMNHDGSVYDC